MSNLIRCVTRAYKKISPAALVCLLLTLSSQSLALQNSSNSSQSPQGDFHYVEKSSVFTPAELLAKFEAEGAGEYTFGAGDELTVEVWDHPELSGKHIIGPDGMITLPQVGAINLAGLSREAGTRALSDGLARYYLDLAVTIRVDRYASNRISVLGRVMKPGTLDFEVPPTLLEAITRAGGLPVGGSGAEKAALARCAIFRGHDQVVWIELKNLLTGKDLALNLRLKRGDAVYIPDSDDQLVYVLGEVNTPGAYRLTPNMTFMDALALAGGPNRDANSKKLHIVRPSQQLSREIDFADLLKAANEDNVSLNEGDIIYVPKRGLSKIGYVMEKIAPFTTYMLFGASLVKK